MTIQLNEVFLNTLTKLQDSGELEKIVEKRAIKMMEEVVDDHMRSYSDFGKSLKEHVGKALAFDMSRLNLEQYNHMVLKIVQRQLDHGLYARGEKQITDTMSKLLEVPPEEMKLSELIEDFIEHSIDKSEVPNYETGEITFHCEEEDFTYLKGYYKVAFDTEKNKDIHDCEYKFSIDDKGFIYGLSLERMWSRKSGDQEKRLFVGDLSGFEKKIFSLMTAKVKIIRDEDEVETSYEGEQDCSC